LVAQFEVSLAIMIETQFAPVSWCYHTNLYEVNIRQYTPEGTFKAFESHLPRLSLMGVETLWFMPITPISEIKRLGTLGSYYACSSYVKTNPEFGSIDDFKELVQAAHALGMKVIIDWVANHTGYGHEWMEGLRRDYYALDPSGNFSERNGWEDVADLDYGNNDMRKAMIDAMKFWIRTCDIDGFRCDMAHLVPLDFWKQARVACDKLKPLFWLAETEHLEYHEVFDASYAWEWMHETEKFFKNGWTNTVLDKVLYRYQDNYPSTSFKLFFTSNHDENSWNGSEFEKYGLGALPLFVLGATWNGLPLMYSGQEIPNFKRLQFFEKDTIDWSHPLQYETFYSKLLLLRKRNKAAGGPNGWGITHRIPAQFERVMIFLRQAGHQEVLVVLNFSELAMELDINDHRVHGAFREIFSDKEQDFSTDREVVLDGFGYKVFEKG
jgi:glycosidase